MKGINDSVDSNKSIDNPEMGALLFIMLLLFTDLAFISLHTFEFMSPLINNPLLSLEKDHGFPEMFQYIKWFWIIILLVVISITRESLHFVTWGFLFLYLLVDDALEIHETVGKLIAGYFPTTPPFGIRPQDLGEITVTCIAGGIFSVLIFLAYIRGSEAFRKATHNLVLLIVALVFFGVFIDLVHVVAHFSDSISWKVTAVLAVVEDGGEMIVASLILWYIFMIALQVKVTNVPLFNKISTIINRPLN